MNIFIYEWVCGGGFLGRDASAPESLLAEGAAMLAAVADDFSRVPRVEVVTLLGPDSSISLPEQVACHRVVSTDEREARFDELAATSDWTVLVAPEFEGILLALASRVVRLGGRLLSPDAAFIELASDKHATVELLHAAGVATPRGVVVLAGERSPEWFNYPAVLKPIDGCGSIGVQRIDSATRAPADAAAYRLEELATGTSVSVALLCGGDSALVLEPCTQDLADDFTYLGGALPLPAGLAERARQLATTAVRAMPNATGYVGVDLVLGDAEDGSGDVVIEINPRYTTSYVGLRAATETNLAQLCYDVATGEAADLPEFCYSVRWNAAGIIERAGEQAQK